MANKFRSLLPFQTHLFSFSPEVLVATTWPLYPSPDCACVLGNTFRPSLSKGFVRLGRQSRKYAVSPSRFFATPGMLSGREPFGSARMPCDLSCFQGYTSAECIVCASGAMRLRSFIGIRNRRSLHLGIKHTSICSGT